MNLIQQFPDISEKIRQKNKTSGRSNRLANSLSAVSYLEEQSITQYYEGEFRRWHLKLLAIIAAIIGTLWFIMVKSAWIYNLVAGGTNL